MEALHNELYNVKNSHPVYRKVAKIHSYCLKKDLLKKYCLHGFTRQHACRQRAGAHAVAPSGSPVNPILFGPSSIWMSQENECDYVNFITCTVHACGTIQNSFCFQPLRVIPSFSLYTVFRIYRVNTSPTFTIIMDQKNRYDDIEAAGCHSDDSVVSAEEEEAARETVRGRLF